MEDIAGLTEDEIEALKAGDGEPEATHEATPEPEAEATPEPEAEATPEPEAEATPEPEATPETTPEPTPEPVPVAKVEIVDHDQLRNTINANYVRLTREIAQKYNNGELDYEQAEVEKAQLNADYQTEISKINAKAYIAEQQKEQTDQAWINMQRELFTQRKEFNDPIVQGALSAALSALYADPKNDSKSQKQLLDEAADIVGKRLNLSTNDKPPQQIPARHKVELPTTLAGIPAAATNEEVGEFDFLTKLDGLKYEEAISKLTPAQRKRFESTV